MGRVSNKVAIITGAASGLGKADAIRLSEEGAKLVLTDINAQEGKLVAKPSVIDHPNKVVTFLFQNFECFGAGIKKM